MMKIDLAGIVEAFRASDSFVVVSHSSPDGDAIGSTLAVRFLLLGLGKARITCVNEDQTPRIYQWLPGADTMRIRRSMKAPVAADLVVMVDIAEKERMGSVVELVPPGAKTLVIDHHLGDKSDADVGYVDTTASAVGEILMDVFAAAGVPVSREVAECLYVSIMTDTGGFRFGNTTPRTHRVAAALLETGIDVSEISARVYDETSAAKLELLKRVLQRMRLEAQGRVAYSQVTVNDMAEAGAQSEDIEGLVNYARNIEGVEVGILFRELDEETTKVSMRARDGCNCAVFLNQFGGGGHMAAAGVTMDMPLEAACAMIVERVQDVLGAAR